MTSNSATSIKRFSSIIAAVSLSIISAVASAEPSRGAVKVECWGRCDLVNLGQVCNSYIANSQPVAVACDDTDVGYGWDAVCGYGTCRQYGTLLRSDWLSAYCSDGGGFDAVVTCEAPAAFGPVNIEKRDDGKR